MITRLPSGSNARPGTFLETQVVGLKCILIVLGTRTPTSLFPLGCSPRPLPFIPGTELVVKGLAPRATDVPSEQYHRLTFNAVGPDALAEQCPSVCKHRPRPRPQVAKYRVFRYHQPLTRR